MASTSVCLVSFSCPGIIASPLRVLHEWGVLGCTVSQTDVRQCDWWSLWMFVLVPAYHLISAEA